MQRYTKVITGGAIALGLALTLATPAFADTGTTTPKVNFFGNLVSAIAQRFNLNQSDVQKVFDDQRAQMKTQMDARFEEQFRARINKAVTEGKLTQDQANKIFAEETLVKSQLQALQGKTGSELKDGLKQIRDSVDQWAKDNNIPKQYLSFEGFKGKRFSHGFKMGLMMR